MGARIADRYDHISIGLRYKVNEQWQHLRALGWNEAGFNFYTPHELTTPVLALRRGISGFPGTLVWHSVNTSDEAVMAEIVNELIYKQARKLASNVALSTRLVKLMRAHALIAEKRSLLAAMGIEISDAKMAQMTAQRKLDRPLFRYGVQVASPIWSGLANEALSISSTVLSMEKISEALAQK